MPNDVDIQELFSKNRYHTDNMWLPIIQNVCVYSLTCAPPTLLYHVVQPVSGPQWWNFPPSPFLTDSHGRMVSKLATAVGGAGTFEIKGSRFRCLKPSHEAFRSNLVFTLLPEHGDVPFPCFPHTKTTHMLFLLHWQCKWYQICHKEDRSGVKCITR